MRPKDKVEGIVTNIVKDCGFSINEQKTRFASHAGRQEVTGLIVNNEKISVPNDYIKEIRKELYYVKKYGIKEHREKVGFQNKYYKDHIYLMLLSKVYH